MKISEAINSRSNPKVKALLELKNSSEHIFVEGYRIIDEVLRTGLIAEEVIYSPESAAEPVTVKAKMRAKNVVTLSRQVFEKLSDTEKPQGLAAFFKKPEYKPSEVIRKAGSKAVFLLLHEIQDPGNLGTIFRTALASGTSGIFLTKRSVSILNTKVVRSSMGSIFSVPFIDNIDVNEAISYIKNSGVSIAAADANSDSNIFETDYTLPVCFILGSEAHGIPPEIMKKADLRLTIPILKQIESLNLSISAAILMYNAVEKFKLYNVKSKNV